MMNSGKEVGVSALVQATFYFNLVLLFLVGLLIALATDSTQRKIDDLRLQVENLTSHVYFPTFNAHLKTCAICSKESKGSDPIICEKGLKLFSQDMKKLEIARERSE
jgi:hypothetical protein